MVTHNRLGNYFNGRALHSFTTLKHLVSQAPSLSLVTTDSSLCHIVADSIFFNLVTGHIGVQCTHRRNHGAPQGTTEKLARQVAKAGAQKATATGRVQNTRRTTGPAQTDICVLILKVCFHKTIHKTYQICNLLLLFYFYYIFFFYQRTKQSCMLILITYLCIINFHSS